MSNTEEEGQKPKKNYLGPVYHVCSDKIAAFSSFNQACKFVVWGWIQSRAPEIKFEKIYIKRYSNQNSCKN